MADDIKGPVQELVRIFLARPDNVSVDLNKVRPEMYMRSLAYFQTEVEQAVSEEFERRFPIEETNNG